jgi:hypothetical protein
MSALSASRAMATAAHVKVNFRRVEYPAEKTRQKIHDIPDLDNFLGDRLLEGR